MGNQAIEYKPVIPSGVLAVLLVVAVESMFFGGLISAYLVNLLDTSNKATAFWPPHGQWSARLPIEHTAINSVILLASALTIHLSFRSIRDSNSNKAKIWLITTFVLGLVFLLFQGYEWAKLIGYGLTVKGYVADKNFGGFFYTIIGAHGIHVIAGLIVLIIVYNRLVKGRYSSDKYEGFSVSRIYWLFVVGLWPILYLLVYLAKKDGSGVYIHYINYYFLKF